MTARVDRNALPGRSSLSHGLLVLLCLAVTACGGGGGGDGSSSGPVVNVTVSGKVTYERVPFFAPDTINSSAGLDYGATFESPARAVLVEVLDSASRSVLATTTTDTSGYYSVAVPQGRNVFVRARAESRQAAPGWHIRVLNNTNGNALYVLDSASFNTGTTDVSGKNLMADSGWPDSGGTTYTGTRAAAPFAILDTMYSAAQFVRREGSTTVDLPALDVFWSAQNTSSVAFSPSTGQIQSTLYRADAGDAFADGIYVLGLASNDTDEYDQHVLAHEFQHYLEDTISRTETPGGAHSIGEKLDLRLAFSEGFASAFSGMVLDDPIYKDSFGTAQGDRFDFDLEANAYAPAGWYNEGSIMSLVWDLYDSSDEAADTVSLGYGPIYDALTSELRTGPALVSVYPFVAALESGPGAPVAGIDALLAARSIAGRDPWGAGETNDGGVPEVLPIYTTLTLGGGAGRVCGTTAAGVINAIGNRLFLRFSLSSRQSVTIRAVYAATGSATGGPTPDPDFVLYRNGILDVAESDTANEEVLTRILDAGDYVIEVYEYSHVDPSPDASRRGVTCMDVSVS